MFKRLLIYVREIVVSLPLHLIKGWKHFGWRGAWLVWCDLVFTTLPTPVTVPGFGPLIRRNEARSLMDNFCLGELRCPEVERAIQSHAVPVIVDLGVNLGMSIRWWFRLNAKAQVIGVEMMQESLDYTTQRLAECHPNAAWKPICCAAAAEDAEPMEIRFSDPLEGTTSAVHASGEQRRSVSVRCLDSIVNEPEVILIKCDIEGYGGYALNGAHALLKRTRYVVTETHGSEEMAMMSRVLFDAGFTPFHLSSRSLWWRRSDA